MYRLSSGFFNTEDCLEQGTSTDLLYYWTNFYACLYHGRPQVARLSIGLEPALKEAENRLLKVLGAPIEWDLLCPGFDVEAFLSEQSYSRRDAVQPEDQLLSLMDICANQSNLRFPERLTPHEELDLEGMLSPPLFFFFCSRLTSRSAWDLEFRTSELYHKTEPYFLRYAPPVRQFHPPCIVIERIPGTTRSTGLFIERLKVNTTSSHALQSNGSIYDCKELNR